MYFYLQVGRSGSKPCLRGGVSLLIHGFINKWEMKDVIIRHHGLRRLHISTRKGIQECADKRLVFL